MTLNAGSMTFSSGGNLELKPGSNLNAAAKSLSGANLIVSSGAMLTQQSTAAISVGSVQVLPGGMLTHAENSSLRQYVLNLNVAGDFDLQAGANISVKGRGYSGGGQRAVGSGPGAGRGASGDYYGGGGGGYGGQGGVGGGWGTGSPGSAGPSYGSLTDPVDIGSGGGGGTRNELPGSGNGGAGGGAVLLTIGGQLILNGTVDADGAQGALTTTYGGGGGSGGSVNLSAANISGSGSVHSDGGSALAYQYASGGGGGGRISLAGCKAMDVPASVGGGTGSQSGSSGTVHIVIPPGCPSAPNPPQNLVTLAAGENSVTAGWDPSATALSYTLQVSTALDFSGLVRSTATVETSATIDRLLSQTDYYLRVNAENIIGASAFSASISTRTPIDLTAPAPPVLLGAVPQSGGYIRVSWQEAYSGEYTDYFNLYRATFAFFSTAGLSPIVLHTTATVFTDLPPEDRAYYYAVTGLDLANNESASSEPFMAYAYHGPNVPVSDLAASFSFGQKKVLLSWNEPAGAFVSSYNIYRDTVPSFAPSAQLRISSGSALTTFADSPSLAVDATYYYVVTSINPVADESAASNVALAGFDVHAPVLQVSGIAAGLHYNHDVSPSVSIADFSSYISSLTLDGADFVNGSAVSTPGAHALSAWAQDVYGSSASLALSFTVDKVAPFFAISAPVDGLVTNQNVSVVFAASDDLTPTAQITVRDEGNNIVTSPLVFNTDGIRNLVLTAKDLAGNSALASVGFILDKTAPSGVTDLRITAYRPMSGELDLAWTAPSDNLTGMAHYILRESNAQLTEQNFSSGRDIEYSTAPASAGSLETLTVSVSTDRTHYFALKSSDVVGNISVLSNNTFQDLEGPALSGLTPAAGQLARPTTFTLQANDVSGVSRVVFSVDGVVLSTRTSAPFSFFWDTLAYDDGPHSLAFDSVDTLGNAAGFQVPYTLFYQPPPVPSILSPGEGYATFTGTLSVNGLAEPGAMVQVLVNALPQASGRADAGGNFSIFLTLPSEGTALITAKASDSKGASAASAPRTVYFDRTAANPPVSFEAQTLPAGRIKLTWAVPSGKTPSSYNIYRSMDPPAFSSGSIANPALRVANHVAGLTFTDLPPADGLYHYAATSNDLSGNESVLSALSPAVSDRVLPTAGIEVFSAQPLGPGQHALRLTLSKVLAVEPLLIYTPQGQDPFPVSLSAVSPTVWSGTLTVTSAMNSGVGTFRFEGTDFAGNVGTGITSGGTALLDTLGPTAAISLNPPSPLKAGLAGLTLTLNEPAAVAPSLSFVTAAGATVPVILSNGPSVWTSTLSILPGMDGAAAFVFSAVDGLGNMGSVITSGAGFTIDSTAPGAPLFLRAASKKAGAIDLTWSAPLGETPFVYFVYRDGVRLLSFVWPAGDKSGSFTDVPPGGDGTYSYTVAAADAAGNEGQASGAVLAVSRSSLPSTPVSLTSALNAFGKIQLDWQAGVGEVPAEYHVFRTTYEAASFAGLTPIRVSTPPLVDAPTAGNGLYHYAVLSADFAGNESADAARTSILWDKAPPNITIEGVSEGGLYGRDVYPAFTASDPALDTASVHAALNGQAFLSGSTVSAEGTYALSVYAASLGGIYATATVHFSLDRTLPVVTVTGLIAGR
ncbi:MAG: fibronectin type III domain-containing protein, partial [Elusimicrobiota bacterium]